MGLSSSAYDLASRYIGVKEVPGVTANKTILKMLTLDQAWPKDDSVPWCSAFVNYICWQLRLPRSKSLLARSWLLVGKPIKVGDAWAGNDIVILRRGAAGQPGPENTTAPGHVGFFASLEGQRVYLLGGNQDDSVSLSSFKKDTILGVRRLA